MSLAFFKFFIESYAKVYSLRLLLELNIRFVKNCLNTKRIENLISKKFRTYLQNAIIYY
jgi:hypothetical protein